MRYLSTLTYAAFVATLTLFALLLPVGCSTSDNAINVGAIMPLTGELAAYGEPVKRGMELAAQEINAAGGIDGRKLSLRFEDDFADPTTAVGAFNKLVDQYKVPMILGPLTSGASMATAPVAERRRVVQLSTMAGTVDLKFAGDYVFRVFASNELQSNYISNAAVDILKAKTAAILYINNSYGQNSKQIIEKAFPARGGKIVDIESYDEGDTDFKTQLVKIKQANPDLIFAPAYWKEGATILKQAKELGITVHFLGEDSWYGPIAEVAGDAADLVIFSSMAFGERYKDQPRMQQFIKSFRENYGKDADSYSATGYDAVYLAKHAIETGGYNSDGVKTALYNTRNFVGALGKISYDEYGDNVGAEFDLYTIRDGKTVRYVDVISEASQGE